MCIKEHQKKILHSDEWFCLDDAIIFFFAKYSLFLNIFSLVNHFLTLVKIGNYQLPQRIKCTPDDKQYPDLF